jgi:hypothetical protein
MTDIEFAAWELAGKLDKETFLIRVIPGFAYVLDFAELFASRRAAHLPKKVHAMWKTLCDLDPDEAVIKIPDKATRWILGIKDTESNEEYMQRRMDAANAGYEKRPSTTKFETR